jgi:ADP-ribose pyrophosphatase YjhB (NUDIX family)
MADPPADASRAPGAAPRDPPRGPVVEAVPEGDDRARLVCPDCGFIRYDNPKIVVGSVITHDGRFLLCRRAIQPRIGYWTLAAGYLELGETPVDGARREAWEEACARIDIDALLGVYHIPRISQVQLIYRARLLGGAFAAGPESQSVQLFRWDEIPWTDIAFPSVRWALNHFRDVEGAREFAPRINPSEDGSG